MYRNFASFAFSLECLFNNLNFVSLKVVPIRYDTFVPINTGST